MISRDDQPRAVGRRPRQEDVTSHYRNGQPGDWRNHFTPEHVAHFRERYHDVLLRHGYEESSDWATPVEVVQ